MSNSNFIDSTKYLWESLDDLAQNDPIKYEQFIQTQLENLSPSISNSISSIFQKSKFGFSIKTTLEKKTIITNTFDKGNKIADYFVNFHHTEKLSLDPKEDHIFDTSHSVPILIYNRKETKENISKSIICDVIISTKNYNLCLKDISFKDYVILMALLKLQKNENRTNSFNSGKHDDLKINTDPQFIQHLEKPELNEIEKASPHLLKHNDSTISSSKFKEKSIPLIEVISSSTYEAVSDEEKIYNNLDIGSKSIESKELSNDIQDIHFLKEKSTHYFSNINQKEKFPTLKSSPFNYEYDGKKISNSKVSSKSSKISNNTTSSKLSKSIISFYLQCNPEVPESYKMILKFKSNIISSSDSIDIIGDGNQFVIFIFNSQERFYSINFPSPIKYDKFKIRSIWKSSEKSLEVNLFKIMNA